MSVTAIGIVIIIISLYAFFFNKGFLYKLTIFFIPFSATAVINLGEQGSGTAIQPYMFIGGIWMLSMLASNYRKIEKYKFNTDQFRAISLLLLFFVAALISLYIPYKINGSELGNQTGELDEVEMIRLTSKNFTQLLYLLYGILFAICLSVRNKYENNYKETIQIYTWSVLFIICWGTFEYILKSFDLPYPDYIFNNSYSRSGGGYLSVLENGALRISSVATEPSILSQSILIILPFWIYNYQHKQFIFSKQRDLILLILTVLFILKSASGSGMISLSLLLLLFLAYSLKKLSTVKKITYTIITLIVTPLILSIISYIFQDVINESLFNKADSFSGIERLSATLDAWDSFIQHPVLGMGWGSITSFDLFIRILSNTGLVGLLIFLLFLIKSIKNQAQSNEFKYKTPVLISFITILVNNSISGFTYTFGHFWFITGILIITRFQKQTSNL